MHNRTPCAGQGASYSHQDFTADPGMTYYYLLKATGNTDNVWLKE